MHQKCVCMWRNMETKHKPGCSHIAHKPSHYSCISTLYTCRPSCDRLHLIFWPWRMSSVCLSALRGFLSDYASVLIKVFLSSVHERFLRSPQKVVANSLSRIQTYTVIQDVCNTGGSDLKSRSSLPVSI